MSDPFLDVAAVYFCDFYFRPGYFIGKLAVRFIFHVPTNLPMSHHFIILKEIFFPTSLSIYFIGKLAVRFIFHVPTNLPMSHHFIIVKKIFFPTSLSIYFIGKLAVRFIFHVSTNLPMSHHFIILKKYSFQPRYRCIIDVFFYW